MRTESIISKGFISEGSGNQTLFFVHQNINKYCVSIFNLYLFHRIRLIKTSLTPLANIQSRWRNIKTEHINTAENINGRILGKSAAWRHPHHTVIYISSKITWRSFSLPPAHYKTLREIQMKSWNAFRSLFAVTTMQFSEQCACHIYRGSGINKASIALGRNYMSWFRGLGE